MIIVNKTGEGLDAEEKALEEKGQELKELVDACEARGEETKEKKSLMNPDGWTQEEFIACKMNEAHL